MKGCTMRAMTIAVLGLSLGAAAALAEEPATLKSSIKGLAAPGGMTGTLGSSLGHSLKTEVRQLKADTGSTGSSATLKSGQGGDATSQPLADATRSSLIRRRASPDDLAAGSGKPQERQSFAAAAGQSGVSSFGLRSPGAIGTGGSLGAESVKQPDAVQKLR